MKLQAPKGTRDIIPQESYKWHAIEAQMRAVTDAYGYREVRTPVFERTELFLRGVGDTTDIVQKEMYTFLDKGGRSITLKPEGTAGVVRQFVEHSGASMPQPTKMYYLNCPVFRYENTQAGRLREHHQFGIELFGAQAPSADAEVIALARDTLTRVGVKGLSLRINNIGCSQCRPNYNEALRAYFAENIGGMCNDCKSRLDKNPMRILDCKEDRCKVYTAKAPVMADYVCDDCKTHFSGLEELLKCAGIDYQIDYYIVRGLDYYTRTVFEFVSEHIGAQSTVCGGGRYDNLIEQLGGPKMPGVGFGMGMERLLMVLEAQGYEWPQAPVTALYIANYGQTTKARAWALAQELRLLGVRTEIDHCDRSMKAQFKYADKLGATYVAVLGEEELNANTIKLRSMAGGEERSMELSSFAREFAQLIK